MLLLIILILFLIGILIFGALLITIIIHEKSYTPKKSDCIIVLGAKTGSSTFLNRKKLALQLYRRGFAKYVISTGSQGKDESLTEALEAALYLYQNNVPKENVFLEELSHITWGNLKYAKEIMNNKGLKSAIIVTTGFHLFRSLRIAKKLNIIASGAAADVYQPKKWYYRFREVIGIIYYFVFRKI